MMLLRTALCFTLVAGSAANTLYFSEYIEGSSYNKGLQIYNPTDTSVSTGNIKLIFHKSGKDDDPSAVMLGDLDSDAGVIEIPACGTVTICRDFGATSPAKYDGAK